MADPAPKKPNRKRRNYQKELERLSFYLETVIRIKDDPDDTPSDYRKGELRAYRDLLEYVHNGK